MLYLRLEGGFTFLKLDATTSVVNSPPIANELLHCEHLELPRDS